MRAGRGPRVPGRACAREGGARLHVPLSVGAMLALVAMGCATASAHPAPLTPRAELARAIDSLVAAPEFRNAHWGVLIVDPDHADTLYAHEAEKLFMPASNMKIVTGATALVQLGPDYRWRTTFIAAGPVVNGVLEGDLVVSGRGDPSVSDHMRDDAMQPLRDIADSLRARGITRIEGRVVAGDDAFPDADIGFGWSWDDLGEEYGAGVDELYFNEGFARIAVHGGARAGDAPTVVSLPAHTVPAMRAQVVTGAPAADGPVPAITGGGLLAATLDTVTHTVIVGGWIAPGASDTLDVVFPDQRAAYIGALTEALAERGIVVSGATLATAAHGSSPTPAPRADTVLTFWSAPLRDVLGAMEKPSQNQIAEIVFKTLALERTGVGTADSARALIVRQLEGWGAAPDGYVIRDGSGLSRYDYVSPETLVRALAAVRRDTAFHVFYDALPIAGVDGTLEYRMRGTLAQGNVHAKTGFVANARSLSGYVTTADRHMLIFSALCNNWTVPVHDVERVQDAIAARLAALTLAEP